MTADRLLLNSYILPGRLADVHEGLQHAVEGERIGLSGIFVSERWETKEIASVMGALSQVTDHVGLLAGATHFGTRHPVVLAGMGATLQTLTKGRFQLGFARGVASHFRAFGIPALGLDGMRDYASLLRRLWAGETVEYRGPAGIYPEMKLGNPCPDPPPMILACVGEKTLQLAGAHFDGVILHPFLTAEAVARSTKIVRQAAEEAGRNPSDLRVYASVVVAPDTLSETQRKDVLDARAASYFMHAEVGRPLVTMNGWDPAPMERLAATDLNRFEYSSGKRDDVRAQLAAGSALLPRHWLETGAAVGTTEECVVRLREYQYAGADEILMVGTTPNHHGDLLKVANQR
ncbi:TIGR03857 family LLM class F420-dependent oxidoreductase [Rhodococcus sp. T2V]|uniref:TIGR03857 family LLM class F420-dependent oxidoreductase n=1 Tax=Rhodococcus sp. T2V TaxID=3034164 RepID=UPI0023E1DF08|nr:TIGR03857 family LLM class F420-dependent oxidoreductase [Rhodococcus sp. T2V]MDF3313209.1 TIGR03857 family LLM class F420-dependent oxidoreductase [Rhodococcus sp. T2V]